MTDETQMTNFTVQDQNAGMDEILAIEPDNSAWPRVTRAAVRDFHVEVVGAADTIQTFAQLIRAAAMKEPGAEASHRLAELSGVLQSVEIEIRTIAQVALGLTKESS